MFEWRVIWAMALFAPELVRDQGLFGGDFRQSTFCSATSRVLRLPRTSLRQRLVSLPLITFDSDHMAIHIPKPLQQALRDFQQRSIEAMIKYIDQFDTSKARAGLVQMPTGSGKTGIIATLARCETRPGPVIVIAPRIGIRDQLTRYIDKRFFEHAGIEASSLPRKLFELKDGNDNPGDLKDLVITTTVQLLTSLQKKNTAFYQKLCNQAVLVLFDEGHYEPALLWSEVVRGLPCARIIFTATAFRDDFKTFDIDPDHAFRYSFDQARRAGFVRNVQIHSHLPERSPVAFAEQIIEAYDRIFSTPAESQTDRPRVIVRCDRQEEIRQIVAAIRRKGRSVIGIHETFNDPASGEHHSVPNPDKINATFWVHQFKLLEGIDDHRFQMLALFSELRSVRSFVQQVGRVIRNPKRAVGATAHVLDHSPRGRQTKLWQEFLEYDKLVERGDPGALDLNQRSLVDTIRDAVPGLLYVDGRFRVPADIAELGLSDLQLPLRANVFHRPPVLSLAEVEESIRRECEEQDLFCRVLNGTPDTAAVLHIRIGMSLFLEKAFFPEPKLGITIVHAKGKYVFIFETGRALGAEAVGGRQVDGSLLRRLFVKGASARLTAVTMHNANLGADQVRTRALTANSVDLLTPSFDEHGYVLSTATGYSRGRRGDPSNAEATVRRYVGVGSGRVSDYGGGFVPFDVWKEWAAEVEQFLDRKGTALPVFSRWAEPTGWPKDPSPRNVLLDLSKVLERYRTTGEDDLPEEQEIETDELCADVKKGTFEISANGKPLKIEIEAEPTEGRYLLKSPALDARYYSTDPGAREGLVRYLNRTQSFRVIPASEGYIYAAGQFSRPLIKFGPQYDDSKMGVLGTLNAIDELRDIKSEKGKKARRNGSGWEQGSLFDFIDRQAAGTKMAQYFSGTEVMVCDDLNDESADFILLQRATKDHSERVVYIHAKAKSKPSNCSASSLHDVCGQAQKNLREVSLFAESGPSKAAKWATEWNGSPHTLGVVKNRIRKQRTNSEPGADIRRTTKNPNADREVWLVLGNLLSKGSLEDALLKKSPPAYAIQAAYLLFSTITNTAAAAAKLRVFCAP